MKTKLLAAFLSASLLTLSSHAISASRVLANGKIEGSYIIGFKKPEKGTKPIVQPAIPIDYRLDKTAPPFGEHSTGQSKLEVAAALGLNGEVAHILDAMNAIHVYIDEKEAERLRQHPLVEYVEQDGITYLGTTQNNPGWALDRFDEPGAPTALDNTYEYISDGTGQTIYILDSGINLNNTNLLNEFGTRAEVVYDVNGGSGADCVPYGGHGTKVASLAAGSTKGVAKNANLKIAKITNQCTGNSDSSTSVFAFNWLAANAPHGTIANWSHYNTTNNCSVPYFDQSLENAIRTAYQAGIIVVVIAGNDGCDTSNYSPANIPEAFVVGATNNFKRSVGKDAIWDDGLPGRISRKGWNIAGFAPGRDVAVIDSAGTSTTDHGTSLSVPLVSGLFAVACHNSALICSVAPTGMLYDGMRQIATVGTVTNKDGSPLTGAYSRFFWKPVW